MEQWQHKGIRLAIFAGLSALFLVAAFILIITYLSKSGDIPEPSTTSGEEIVEIDGHTITLRGDPEKAVMMDDQQAVTAEPMQVQESLPVLAATATQLLAEPTPVPTATPVPPQVIYVDYVVKPGDSLYSVSAEVNSSIELLATNGIDSGDLVAGTVINVPAANPNYCPGMKAYVVRDRDTIYGIALSLNSTTEAILGANNFPEGYLIKATEVICVP